MLMLCAKAIEEVRVVEAIGLFGKSGKTIVRCLVAADCRA